MIPPNIMMEQNGKRYQGTTPIKTFEYKNTKKWLTKLRFILRKLKNNQIIQLGIPEPQGAWSDELIPGINDFTHESVFQCDVWVVKNTFADDSK